MEPECVEGRILRQAMDMELESQKSYLATAEKVQNALGRSMFKSLAMDEQHHYDRLLQIQEGDYTAALGECSSEFENADSRINAMFSQFGQQASLEVAAEADDLAALDIAMEMERKGYDLYSEAASKASDSEAQKVFVFLAGEEEKHFEVLQNMHRYLSDPGNWFLEQEQGLLDGGD